MSDLPWIIAGVAVGITAAPGVLHLMSRGRRREGLDFNIIDDAIHHLDTEEEPWTVHLEVRVAGTIDEERLRRAVKTASDRHLLARVFQKKWRPWHTVYRWEEGVFAIDPVRVETVKDDADVAGHRQELLSAFVPIQSPPPFRVLLVHAPGGDFVMLSFNHAACDGVGTLRFLRSIARAYGDENDPVEPPRDLAERNLATTSAPKDLGERWRRLSMLRRALVDAIAAPPARIAIDGGIDTNGFGSIERMIDIETSARLAKKDASGGTVNDRLLSVLHLAIAKWNEQHGAKAERIGTMMPVNVRPRDRWTETVGNIVYFMSISSTAEDRAGSPTTLPAIVEQTSAIKEQGTAAALREILFASPTLLIEVKRRLPSLLPLGGERFIDSAVLSNVGRVDEPIRFGDLAVTDLFFCPPCRMPLGLAVGAATYDKRLSLCFRYRHAQFSRAAAERFVDLYAEILTGTAS